MQLLIQLWKFKRACLRLHGWLFSLPHPEFTQMSMTLTSMMDHVGYRNLRSVEISEGAFGDDIVLMTTSEKVLQDNLSIWNGFL